MIKDLEDVVMQNAARIMIPFIQIYSLYVFVHGHISPGGGFQGGCIMAGSIILLSIAFNLNEVKKRASEKTNAMFCSLGVFIYVFTGLVPVLLGGNFLNYAEWSKILRCDAIMARYYGMAMIELGVQIAVMAVMISIFFDLATAGAYKKIFKVESNGTDIK
jgi:multicomponent Na+:H+ antiporter subunit B